MKTFLSFEVSEKLFAFLSRDVYNILEIQKITKVPNTSDFILGVINLHGIIVPVVDMSDVLGFGKSVIDAETNIIIVAPLDAPDARLGILVHRVHEVFEIHDSEIKNTVFVGGSGLIDNFEGTINVNDTFVHIINIEYLLSQVEK